MNRLLLCLELSIGCHVAYLKGDVAIHIYKIVMHNSILTLWWIISAFDFSGNYFVVGVDIEQYDKADPSKYLRGFLTNERNLIAEKAFGSYLGVLPSSPVGFEDFAASVNAYMERPPFSFPNPLNYLGGNKVVRNILLLVTSYHGCEP